MEKYKFKNIDYSRVLYSEIEGKFRIDSEYYDPYYISLMELIQKKEFKKFHEVVDFDYINFSKSKVDDFKYIEISNVNLVNGFFNYEIIESSKAPSRAQKLVFKNDILVSLIRPVRNAVAYILNDEKNLVASSGFCKLSASGINPYFLFALLKTNFYRDLLVRLTTATMYPAFSETDFRKLPCPIPSKKLSLEIEIRVKEAQKLYEKSKKLYREIENNFYEEFGLINWHPNKLNFKHYNIKLEIEDNHSVIELSRMIKSDRLDAEYWDAACLKLLSQIQKFETKILRTEASILNGFPFNSKQFTETGEGEPFIRIRDCKPHFIQTSDLTKLESSYALKIKPKTKKAQNRDIVIGMDGLKWFYGSLIIEHAYVNQRVCHLRLHQNTELTPEYVLLVINSKIGQMQLLRQMTIADTVGHIKNKDVAGLIIPLSKKIKEITKKIKTVQSAEQQSNKLIETTKSAVEIFIKKDEKSALNYLKLNLQ